MRQRWVLQGKAWSDPDQDWLDLVDYRRRKDARIHKVRARAKSLGMRAQYRVVLRNVEDIDIPQ